MESIEGKLRKGDISSEEDRKRNMIENCKSWDRRKVLNLRLNPILGP